MMMNSAAASAAAAAAADNIQSISRRLSASGEADEMIWWEWGKGDCGSDFARDTHARLCMPRLVHISE